MQRFFRRIIRITGDDSPNVRYARAELEAGRPPSNRIVVPGVLPWSEYLKRRTLWPKDLQQIGLDAQFVEDSSTLLFPPDVLIKANQRHDQLRITKQHRKALAMGIDPGEGVADTVWTLGDDYGVLYQMGFKTPDPSKIVNETIGLFKRWHVPPENTLLDAGGGLTIAGMLRQQGYSVKTVYFGESPVNNKRRRTRHLDRVSDIEAKGAYTNRRSQMYGEASDVLNPDINPDLFGIPKDYDKLMFELSKMPRIRNREGKLYMLPKYKRDKNSKEQTLTELIGRSPDYSDSFVLFCHSLLHRQDEYVIGAV